MKSTESKIDLMNSDRNTIFISHATPEDNRFTEWLYTQLTLAGYKCWCDLEGLYGGERDFSKEIQNVIENQACKFLLVFSKTTFLKDFVVDEYEFARSVAKKKNLKDFINPIKIDDVDFSIRIGLNRYNHFIFQNSWPNGLHKLLRKLNFDKVPRSHSQKTEILSTWAKNTYALNAGISNHSTRYYSNWWKIDSLPEHIYVFQYNNETQAQAILEEDVIYPKLRHGNCVVAFQKQIVTICAKHDDIEIIASEVFVINVGEILKGYQKDDFPTFTDAENFLKRLLKKSLKDTLFRLGLSRHKMSSKQECFFYKVNQRRAVKVRAEYPGGKTRRTLFGKYGQDFWHFGISFKVLLEPFVCYSLKSHLIFTSDGFKKWSDDSTMFSARRKKGKRMFNREWRDFLMTTLHSLKDEEGKIFTVIHDNHLLEMMPYTISFQSDFDYKEPTKTSRLGLLADDFSEEDDELEEMEGDLDSDIEHED